MFSHQNVGHNAKVNVANEPFENLPKFELSERY
jgi:hypothetical protein